MNPTVIEMAVQIALLAQENARLKEQIDRETKND